MTNPAPPDSLDLHFSDVLDVFRRRWWSATLIWSGTLILAATLALLQKPTYEAQGQILFRVSRTASLLGFGDEKEGQANPSSLTLQSSPMKTQSVVLQSNNLAQQTIDTLHLTDAEGKPLAPKALLAGLKIKENPGADVLELHYQDSDPQRAAAIVNQIMQQYLAYNVASSRTDAIAVRQFILGQLPKTEAALRQADAALRQFKEHNGITDLDTQTRELVQNQSTVTDSLVKAQTDLAATTARLSNLQQKLGMDAVTALHTSAVSQSEGVQQALKAYQQVETDLQNLRGKYLDTYPQIVNLQQQEQELRALLQQRIQALAGSPNINLNQLQMGTTEQGVVQDLINTDIEQQALRSRILQLGSALTVYQTKASTLPRLEQQQRRLQLQLDAAQSTYQTLLKKLQETQVIENQNTGSAEIIDRALVPNQATHKKQLILLVLGVAGGIVLAALAMIGLELKDQRLKSVREAKKLFDYRVLGDIPHDRLLAAPGVAHSLALAPDRIKPTDPFWAAYHLLQANLRFFSSQQPLKVILVTSSVRKEGKSTVSAHLAMTLAQLGHSVVLIDADLHAPTQHTIWRCESSPGLSDVLLSGVPLSQGVRSLQPRLDLLPCGTLPAHPLVLLGSDSMVHLTQSLSRRYDYVILDSPPLLVDADAITLSKLADGVLVVIRPDQVDVTSARAAKSLLEQFDSAVLGTIMNAVEPQIQHISYR